MAGGLTALITDQPALQTLIAKSIVVPYLASIPGEEERAEEVTRLGKTFGNKLGGWVNLARRSIA